MTGNEYQKLASVTNDNKHTYRLNMLMMSHQNDVAEVINACLGLTGEAGELVDVIKKWIFHEKPLDREHLKKELGDLMWYVAMLCHAMHWDLDDVMQTNIDKLKARYPEGKFDPEKSNHRQIGDI